MCKICDFMFLCVCIFVFCIVCLYFNLCFCMFVFDASVSVCMAFHNTPLIGCTCLCTYITEKETSLNPPVGCWTCYEANE